MYMLADFGNPLNKRLKRAFQRGLYPSDDAITAVQKAGGRKPTKVIADAFTYGYNTEDFARFNTKFGGKEGFAGIQNIYKREK